MPTLRQSFEGKAGRDYVGPRTSEFFGDREAQQPKFTQSVPHVSVEKRPDISLVGARFDDACREVLYRLVERELVFGMPELHPETLASVASDVVTSQEQSTAPPDLLELRPPTPIQVIAIIATAFSIFHIVYAALHPVAFIVVPLACAIVAARLLLISAIWRRSDRARMVYSFLAIAALASSAISLVRPDSTTAPSSIRLVAVVYEIAVVLLLFQRPTIDWTATTSPKDAATFFKRHQGLILVTAGAIALALLSVTCSLLFTLHPSR